MSASITMSYNSDNRQAIDMLQLLLASGYFTIQESAPWTAEEEKEAALYTSQVNAAHLIARHV